MMSLLSNKRSDCMIQELQGLMYCEKDSLMDVLVRMMMVTIIMMAAMM